MPAALITGVLGQDGWFLSELLRGKGYRVVGIDRVAPTAVGLVAQDHADGR